MARKPYLDTTSDDPSLPMNRTHKQAAVAKNAELIGRLTRWLEAFGEPTGLGRASPDNEMIYLLRDCKEALENG